MAHLQNEYAEVYASNCTETTCTEVPGCMYAFVSMSVNIMLNKHRSGHTYTKIFMPRLTVRHLQECVQASPMLSPGLGEQSTFCSSCPVCEAAQAPQGSAWFRLNRKPLYFSLPSFLSLQMSPYKVKPGSLPMSPGAGTTVLLDSDVSEQPTTHMNAHPLCS